MTTDLDRAPRSAAPEPSADPPGESFGQYLVRERELRGFTLQQISDQTRIGVANLRALEGDDLSRLPARVFVLGYIRAYAQAIGLSPDEAVLRFDEQSQKIAPAAEKPQRRRLTPPKALRRRPAPERGGWRRGRRPWTLALLVLAVLAAVCAGALLVLRRR